MAQSTNFLWIKKVSLFKFLQACLALGLLAACASSHSQMLTLPSYFDLQGHRGARGLFPENSLEGFQKTLEMGVNTLELDLAMSADGHLLISHEPYLHPTICLDPQGRKFKDEAEGKKYNLYQMTLAEIQACDCGSLPHPRFPQQAKLRTVKPTLQALIDLVRTFERQYPQRQIRFNMELKAWPEGDGIFHPAPQAFAQALYELLLANNMAERTCVQSFDIRCLQAMRRIAPKQTLALLVESPGSAAMHIERLGFVPEVYSPYYKMLTQEEIVWLKERGIKAIPWTVNASEDMLALVKMGVDGLISDYPDRFLALFPKREKR
jgi:glycerophosphoryl diester phosphodiesterase